MTAIEVIVLLLVAGCGTAVVLEREPLHQAMVFSLFGMVLATLFVVVQAPDVALSELAVGVVIVPAIILLTLAKVRGMRE